MSRLKGCVLAVLLLQGCAQTNTGSEAALPIDRLYGSGQCGGLTQPAVVWINGSTEWRRFYAQATRARMTPSPLPAVDFSREGVLLIAMGQQPSAGYGLRLAGGEATVQNSVLNVPVDWIEPASGYAQAQVISNPCLFIRLPMASFTQMEIRDQQNQLRLQGRR
ncbi:MAG: hypothetical protein CSA09_02400 [Candidatus Contendobacter odensis]|uniref:PrcB C-terminal domain-containing protein n=1 Tax=Candidatus Contendibacter odensensis TaxID=1400860 RepID=A0A2G6PGH0_9GAMM|nr:MAG: hypothetical protein CSA09_02400 [Candidatus Contendobacter odensis]